MTRRRNPASAALILDSRRRHRSRIISLDQILEHAILVILLALVPLRVVLAETHTFELSRLFRGIDVPGTSPAATFAIVTVIIVLCTVVVALRLRRGQQFKWTGGEIGAGLLLLAGILSTIRAGQKHLAVVGVLDFLALLLYCFALRQLLHDRHGIRIALTVVLASGGMIAAKCAYQRWIELPATIKYYEEHKKELLSGHNNEKPQIDDQESVNDRRAGLLHDYEARLKSGSATAYFNHPNVLASGLILIIFTAIGVAWTRRTVRASWTLLTPIAVAAISLLALSAAQSKGAVAAALLSGTLLIARRAWARLFSAAPRSALIIGWIALGMAAAGMVTTLHFRPHALGLSMFYRSMYWQGAWKMMLDQGPLGVGADNFGRHFMRYKAIECPEDVDDPHGWPIKSLSEWGVLGGIGLVAMLIGISWKIAAGLTRRTRVVPVEGQPAGTVPQHSIIINLALCLCFFVIPWAFHDRELDFVLLSLAVGMIPFSFFFIAAALEDLNETDFSSAPLPQLAAPLLAGLFGFLLHTSIDLGLFVAGTATLFFAMLAIVLSLVDQSSGSRSIPRRRWALPTSVIGGAAAAAVLVLLAIPAGRAARQLHLARIAPAPDPSGIEASKKLIAYRGAITAYGLDGTALMELIETLAEHITSKEEADRLLTRVGRLRQIDPWNSSVGQSESLIYYRRYIATHQRQDLEAAITALRGFVAAAPGSPYRWITLADLLEQDLQTTDDSRFQEEASRAIERALDLDARRIYVSRPNRLPENVKSQLRSRLEKLSHRRP